MEKSVNASFASTDPLQHPTEQPSTTDPSALTLALIQQAIHDFTATDVPTRMAALGRLSPCPMPWATFAPLRQALKLLQKDPDPAVRALALQVEQEAEKVATLAALQNLRAEADEEAEDEWKQRERKRNKPRHLQRFCPSLCQYIRTGQCRHLFRVSCLVS